MSNKYSEKVPEFGCSGSSICSENTDFEPLRKRKDSDPMRLYNRILQQLQLLFSQRHTSYTSSQMTALTLKTISVVLRGLGHCAKRQLYKKEKF